MQGVGVGVEAEFGLSRSVVRELTMRSSRGLAAQARVVIIAVKWGIPKTAPSSYFLVSANSVRAAPVLRRVGPSGSITSGFV